MPEPCTEKQVRGFLGMLNYIARFISQLTPTCEPIFKLLRKTRRSCGIAISKRPSKNQTEPRESPGAHATCNRKTSFPIHDCVRRVYGVRVGSARWLREEGTSHLLFKQEVYRSWDELLNVEKDVLRLGMAVISGLCLPKLEQDGYSLANSDRMDWDSWGFVCQSLLIMLKRSKMTNT